MDDFKLYGKRRKSEKMRKREPKSIDRKKRKLLTMCRSLHSGAYVDGLYWKRKNSRNGLISAGECVRIEKTSSGFYLKEQNQQLVAEVVPEGVISNDEHLEDVKTQLLQQHKENVLQERMHSSF